MSVVATDSMFVYLKNLSSSHKLPVIFSLKLIKL